MFGCFGLVNTIYKWSVFHGNVGIPEGSICYAPYSRLWLPSTAVPRWSLLEKLEPKILRDLEEQSFFNVHSKF